MKVGERLDAAPGEPHVDDGARVVVLFRDDLAFGVSGGHDVAPGIRDLETNDRAIGIEHGSHHVGEVVDSFAGKGGDHDRIRVQVGKTVEGRRLGLTNLRGVRIESGYFLQYLLPPHSAEALHIYFPDPWPKLKHRRHRLVNERFPALAHQALVPGGTVFLRTDDVDYFGQMRRVFAADARFVEVATPSELLALKTDFEADFNAQGIPTQHAAYRVAG